MERKKRGNQVSVKVSVLGTQRKKKGNGERDQTFKNHDQEFPNVTANKWQNQEVSPEQTSWTLNYVTALDIQCQTQIWREENQVRNRA